MTFTDQQQAEHREVFVKACRQKAWETSCHANWIGKQLDDLVAEYAKLKEDDDTLAADIREAETAVDSHTVDNRNKRKAMQERRNQLAKLMQALGANMGQGQKALEQLHGSIESSLALAKHAEGWSWRNSGGNANESQSRDGRQP